MPKSKSKTLLNWITGRSTTKQSSAEDAIKYAVVGYGNAGQAHAGTVDLVYPGRLVAICDIDDQKIKLASGNHPHTNIYSDIDEMISTEEIDLISVCTPHNTHCPIAVKALNKKVNVLTEKPMATNLRDADLMINTASENGVSLQTVFQWRYERAPLLLKKEIAEGKLGRILSTSISLKWKKEDEYYRNTWKGRMNEAGGGVLINQAIHMIDLARWFNGEINRVKAFAATSRDYIDVEDNLVGIIRYSNGAFGTIDLSTSTDPEFGTFIEVVGTNYSVRLSKRNILEWGGKSREEINEFNKQVREENRFTFGKPYFSQAHISLITDFIESVKSHKETSSNCYDSRSTLNAVLALMESAQDEREVKI